ncbi:DUF58 domain-containing protein [bacterium]|nr:DUF58 domain-containing protein [bacterium]MBU3956148.1 DUF58 domain-containing protein [bacterium]MBU4134059.1 DUF58 domain-containing protein [bacterium]
MINEKEIFKKVLKIEIYARFLAQQLFTGKYASSFKGKGIEFSEVRPYTPGDDVRSIDWNITARMNYPYIKEFTEERQLSVLFMLDIGASMHFGTSDKSKREFASEIASLLAWTSARNGDKAGLILFSGAIEKYIPPRKGRFHIMRIIREMLYAEPNGRGSDIHGALEFASRVFRKRSIIFVFSDFFGFDTARKLRILASRHDVVGVRVRDKSEETLPNCGIVRIKDSESARSSYADFSSPSSRKIFSEKARAEGLLLSSLFNSAGCDLLKLDTEKDYISPLLNLFRTRSRRR